MQRIIDNLKRAIEIIEATPERLVDLARALPAKLRAARCTARPAG